ncbi:MAG: hypothetical protein ACRDHD_05580 [Candidatus Limnocylindria bacterium]
MSTTERPIPSGARPWLAPLALVVVLGLVLAACGGGGGGGNGASAFKLRVAVINETETDATVSLDTFEPGEATTLATCTAQVITYDLPEGEEWILVLNGQTVIDSLELTDLQIDRNLIAEVIANEDGSVEQLSLAPGALIGPPAQAGICN